MATPRTGNSPLVFCGSPRRLKLLGPLPAGNDLIFKPDKSIAEFVSSTRHPFKKKQDRQGNVQDLKFKLDSSTPPGLYKTVVKSAGKNVPVEIHVEAHPRISVSPRQMAISGKSGEKVRISLMLTNRGNTTVEIPRTDSPGIYDDNGLETAFASTYRQKSTDANRLLGHFVGKLREGHGGLLKLRILKGFGALKPASSISIEVETQIPSRLKSGHHYHGVWRIASINYKITLAVKK